VRSKLDERKRSATTCQHHPDDDIQATHRLKKWERGESESENENETENEDEGGGKEKANKLAHHCYLKTLSNVQPRNQTYQPWRPRFALHTTQYLNPLM